MTGTMEFDAFARMLASELGVFHDGPLTPATGLYDDLGLDSLLAFSLLIIVEAAAGLDVPPAELPELFTLGDAHAYYEHARQLVAVSGQG
jgi:acyl carrier protein